MLRSYIPCHTYIYTFFNRDTRVCSIFPLDEKKCLQRTHGAGVVKENGMVLFSLPACPQRMCYMMLHVVTCRAVLR